MNTDEKQSRKESSAARGYELSDAEKHEESQLIGFDASGRQPKGWTNKLIWGDNKLILSSLKSGALRRQIEEAGGLKLIYTTSPAAMSWR